MKRFNCTLADKRGEFGECMEAHNTGRYVLFSDVEKLQRRMQEMLDKSNSTGVAIERAISTGSVLADHPLKSRLDLLANHHKRERAIADRCKLLTDLLREARNPLITAMDASSEDASAETCELLELIDSALAGTPQAQPDADWTEATTTPTAEDYRELQAQRDQVQSRLKGALDLLRDLHEHIGASIPQTVSEHYRGCDLLDRIDAVLAGQVPDHPEQPLDMVQEGWKLVPVNPTSEMISAGNAALAYDCCSGTADEAWPAMLAAAPKHQGGEPCAIEPPSSSPA